MNACINKTNRKITNLYQNIRNANIHAFKNTKKAMKQIRVFSFLFVHIFFNGRREVKTECEKTRRHTDLRNQITQTKIEKYDSPKKNKYMKNTTRWRK